MFKKRQNNSLIRGNSERQKETKKTEKEKKKEKIHRFVETVKEKNGEEERKNRENE
jgi:hypothetical protein